MAVIKRGPPIRQQQVVVQVNLNIKPSALSVEAAEEFDFHHRSRASYKIEESSDDYGYPPQATVRR